MHILLKRKTQLLFLIVAPLFTLAISTCLILPNNEPQPHILVTVGRQNSYVPAIGCGISLLSSTHKTQINSKIVIHRDRFLIQDVVTFLNLAMRYPDLYPEKGWFITL
ncbi:MAG: hypothetical protein PVJ77_16265 [Desulfobacterales bacterium]